MNNKSLFESARQLLIKLTAEGLPNDLKHKAEFIVELHLSEDTFPMSDISIDDQRNLCVMIAKGASLEEVKSKLTFENTTKREGIFRVLVRTHLNRQGCGQVSMGMPANRKTLSPRILNYTDSIDVINATETEIISDWLKFALENRDSNKPEVYYDDRAINALEALLDKVKRDGTLLSHGVSANTLERELNANRGWCGIVLGIITGLNYLRSENWIELRDKSFENDLTYKQIDSMIQDCQNNICGYGYALSGSFFGDLGSPHFVKDDVHVRDGVNSLYDGLNSAEARVRALINLAQSSGQKPRVLDKILYLGGSGNYYLLGIKLKNSQLIKSQFIQGLNKTRL